MSLFDTAIDGVVQNTNVICIAFNLIIIRAAANRVEETETHRTSNKLTTMAFGSQPVLSVQYTTSTGTDDVTVYP
jgi:hypothetical protein